MPLLPVRLSDLVLAIVATIVLAMTGGIAFGQSASRTAFINPFPQGDVYRLYVVGDWYADGLHGALDQAFDGHARVKVQREVIQLRTLRRSNWDADVSRIEDTWKTQPIDIAVVMFGVSEIGAVRMPGSRRFRFGSEPWKSQYVTRVDRMMKALKGRTGAVYWLGLPPVRRSDRNESYQQINEIFRERAYINGVKFIDIGAGFSDEAGEYSSYGPDLDGKISLLRSDDGNYFTRAGNRKLAHFAEREIRRDLSRAVAERTVPLAGSELEQRRIRPSVPQAAPAREGQKTAPRVQLAKPAASKPGRTPPQQTVRFGAKGSSLKADNGKVVIAPQLGQRRGKQVTLTIVRPAISAAVLDIVTRKQSSDQPARLGDSLAQTLPGGATLLSSVTPANPSVSGGPRGKLSPTQSPYFKVWAKGERLLPEKGRADDFVWPLPEPVPVVRVSQEARPNVARRRQQMPGEDGLPPLPARNPRVEHDPARQ